MCNLQNFQTAGACPTKLPAGTEIDLYVTCASELAGWPQTVFELSAGTAPGDTVQLAETFDFTGAPAGTGYWRRFTAVVNKNKFEVIKVGDEGAESLTAALNFMVTGTNKDEVEFANLLTMMSGCIVAMMRPRGSTYMEGVGVKSLPAVIESITLDGGEKAGDLNSGVYRLKYDGTPWFYDDATLLIDETPNP